MANTIQYLAVFTKDPAEIKSFSLDWSEYLESGDTIDTSVWAIDAGIVNDADINSTTTTTITISTGTDSERYDMKNTITTVAGLIGVRTVQLSVECR